MRRLLLLAGSAFGTLVAFRAAAQDVPASPPDTASPAPPPAAPTEPAPAPPAPPPVAPSASPPAEAPSVPPPPAPPVKKEVAPADVTLEETPEEPSGPKPGGKARPNARRHPKPEATEPPEAPPEAVPESTPEAASKKPPAPENGEGDEKSTDESEEKSKKDDGQGLLGPFRIGVVLGTGLPSIFSFGGMIKLTRYFGAGINIGLIPAVRLSFYGDAQLSYQEYDIYARLFPFGGALFAGAGVGYASVKGTFQDSLDTSTLQAQARSMGIPLPANLPNPISFESDGSVRVLVLTPTIGLLHTFGSGFTIGIDVGAQIPIAPSDTHFDVIVPPQVPQQIRDQYIAPNEKKVEDTLNSVSRTVIPTLNLRVGWLI